MRIGHRLGLGLVVVALAVVGCEETSDGGSSGGGSSDSGTSASSDSGSSESGSSESGSSESGASEDEIDECQGWCSRMLEFDCIDADEHESCFTACGSASAATVEVFNACYLAAEICDGVRECYLNLVDAEDPDPTGNDAPTCVEACNAYLATPCDPPISGVSSCEEFCSSIGDALAEIAVMCLENADGCTLPAECSFPGG